MAHIIVLGLVSCEVTRVETEAFGILIVVDRESYINVTYIGHIKHRGTSLPVLEYLDLGYTVVVKITRVLLYVSALCTVGHKTHKDFLG